MLLEQQIISMDGVGLIYRSQASKPVQKGHCAPLKIKIHIFPMEMLNRHLLSQISHCSNNEGHDGSLLNLHQS